jgi:hypothetical protein
VNNVKTPDVLFSVNDDTSTTHIAASGNHDNIARVEFDKVSDLVLLKVELDCVVDMDQWIRIADSATIMSDNVRSATVADSDAADFEEFIFCFLGCDAVDRESALHIVEQTEVFAGLFNGDNVYNEGR